MRQKQAELVFLHPPGTLSLSEKFGITQHKMQQLKNNIVCSAMQVNNCIKFVSLFFQLLFV